MRKFLIFIGLLSAASNVLAANPLDLTVSTQKTAIDVYCTFNQVDKTYHGNLFMQVNSNSSSVQSLKALFDASTDKYPTVGCNLFEHGNTSKLLGNFAFNLDMSDRHNPHYIATGSAGFLAPGLNYTPSGLDTAPDVVITLP